MGILLKQKEPGGKPAVVSVGSTGGTFFIEGFTAENEYLVAVDWNGDAPGILKFDVNGTVYETSADQSGGRYTFDMGSAFTGSLSPTGNTLKVTAVNYSGVSSEPETLHPIVIPLPSWSVKMGDFEIKQDGKHLVYKLDTSWPEEPIEILVDENHLGSVLWTAWGFVPYVGGRVFGIPGTQSFLTIEAKTDGSGSIAGGGKSGFNAAGGEIEIKLGAKGNLQYEPSRGLEWKETSLILGLGGKIERSVGPVTLIPALEGAVSLPVIGGAIGWFNDRAEIKGSISSGSEMALEIMSATGEIGFNRADVETSSGIGLGLGIDIIENLSAEVSGGGTAKVFWQVPAAPDYFKKLETELTANITFSFLGFEWTTGYTHPFTYPETEPLAVRIPMSPPVLRPVSREFLTKGPYNIPASKASRLPMEIGGTGLQSDHKIIENVFPYSEPAVAVHNGGAAVAYVYLDPNDPVHQDTEIYVTLFNGATYSTPAPILNDTRAEFSPTIAYDGSGKIVCAWQRVKDENFTSGLIEDLAAAMEIVYAVYDPAAPTPAWSEPLAMTDNAYMDYNPMLRRGADGSLLLLWFSNAGNRLIGDSEYPTVAHYALWNGTGFGTPEPLAGTFESCFKFSLAYSGTEAILAYTKDMDGVLVTPQGATEPAANDQEIFFLTFDGAAWSTPVRVTDDGIPDANPQVAYRADTRELAWLRGDSLVRLTGLDPLSVEPVREGVFSAGMTDFRLYADPHDHLVLIWQDSDEKGIDLFYSVYDHANTLWSNDLRLTEDAGLEKDFSGAFAQDGLLHLVFNKKDLNVGITDLYHLTYALAVDLAVGPSDLWVEPEAPAPGDDVQLVCRVTNQGDLAVVNGTVSFYLGNPAAGGTLLGTASIVPAQLRAGEIGSATIPWILPPDFAESAVHSVYAVASAGEGVFEDESNNTTRFDVIRPDLNALRCLVEQNPDGDMSIRALVRNDGFLAAENVEVLFKVEEHIIGTLTIPGILPGKTAEVVFPASLELYNYSTWQPVVSVTADPENWIPEMREDNNIVSFVFALEMVSPAVQDFGQVHYAGSLQSITIYNKTTIGLPLGSIVLTGEDAHDFRIFDDPCSGTTIQPLQSGLVGVAFSPTSLGVKNAELLIKDNDGRVLWRVPLTGRLDYLIPGDLDDDGHVGLSDAILALQLVAGLQPQGVHSIVAISGDGRIGLEEAIYALQHAAELRW